MTQEICKYCKFFDAPFCRRYPPQIRVTGSSNIEAESEFPQVTEHDYCGEFSFKFDKIEEK